MAPWIIQHCADHAALHPVTGRGGPLEYVIGDGADPGRHPGDAPAEARERASSGWGWLPWAVLSAVCASLTSILGKVGMTGVDSYVGTAIRNMVVLAMAWALVLGLGLQREIPTLSRKNWGFLAVSGVSTGLSWMFYYRALQEGRPAFVAPIDKLSILVTVGFSCLVLRERLSRRLPPGCSCSPAAPFFCCCSMKQRPHGFCHGGAVLA